jgi:hypothetical protein
VKFYPPYITGHGRKAYGKSLTERWKKDPKSKPRWVPIGTRRKSDNGRGTLYWKVKVDNSKRWPFEHRHIMASLIGRPLLGSEHVHHVNHDTLDNRLENLVLLTAAEHTREHKLLNGRWSIKYTACLNCKSAKREHVAKGHCTACYQKLRK